MWSEIYNIFHDGRGLKDNQERVVVAGSFDPSNYTLSYEDGEIEYFNLYDSSTNGSFGVDKSEFLQIMEKYIKEFKNVSNCKR